MIARIASTLMLLGFSAMASTGTVTGTATLLKSDELRVAGSGGCNNLMGGFELDGDRLRFARVASTMMACPEGMEQERAFLAALEQLARWHIAGAALPSPTAMAAPSPSFVPWSCVDGIA
jgi:heat shock protein HslJ